MYCGLDLDKAVAQRSFLVLAAFFRETQPLLHHLCLTYCTALGRKGRVRAGNCHADYWVRLTETMTVSLISHSPLSLWLAG